MTIKGFVGSLINAILPAILISPVVIFVFGCAFWNLPEVLSKSGGSMFVGSIFYIISTIGFLYLLLFYDGFTGFISLGSKDPIISFNGKQYIVESTDHDFSIRETHATGGIILLFILKAILNTIVILLAFIRNIIFFFLCIFVSSIRDNLSEQGEEFFDDIEEHKVFSVFVAIIVLLNSIFIPLMLVFVQNR